MVHRLFVPADAPDEVRDPEFWHAIIEASRARFGGAHARELLDALDGIEAATQLSRLARRVSELTRGADEGARLSKAGSIADGFRRGDCCSSRSCRSS